jgi:REP element-mobilizing transposase RayT
MKYDPQKHHRRSTRLKGYDYSRAGAYFVTIVTQHRESLLGEITANGVMRLNDAGQMVEKWWLELNHKFSNVDTDEYVIMPNHFHGIVVIVDDVDTVGADLRVGPDGDEHTESGKHTGLPLPQPDAGVADLRVGPDGGEHTEWGTHTGVPLPTVIQWLKTMTTNEYIRGVKTLGWPPFPGKLWQRNYYEHIIRNDEALTRIWQYITNNPLRWALDDENPLKAGEQKAGEYASSPRRPRQ